MNDDDDDDDDDDDTVMTNRKWYLYDHFILFYFLSPEYYRKLVFLSILLVPVPSRLFFFPSFLFAASLLLFINYSSFFVGHAGGADGAGVGGGRAAGVAQAAAAARPARHCHVPPQRDQPRAGGAPGSRAASDHGRLRHRHPHEHARLGLWTRQGKK